MDVAWSVVLGDIKGFLDWEIGEVLITEGNDLLLGDEKGELVLTSFAKFAELDALHFGTDDGSEVLDLGVVGEEVGKAWVGVFAVLNGLEVLVGRVLDIVPIYGISKQAERLISRWRNAYTASNVDISLE